MQNANASAVTAYGSQVTLMEGGANQGRIDLHDGSTLDIQRRNHGAVTADHSQITLGEQANNQGRSRCAMTLCCSATAAPPMRLPPTIA
ncbi:hypothetical protein N4G58_06110 [Edwardsiella piscicida]|nr:hypothetical protein N4G58_06110 [Edwardsiella piscicida]